MKKLIVTEDSLDRAKRIFDPMPIAFAEFLDALFVPEQQDLKPFGPGTRLRAANGDTLLVVKYYNYSAGATVIEGDN